MRRYKHNGCWNDCRSNRSLCWHMAISKTLEVGIRKMGLNKLLIIATVIMFMFSLIGVIIFINLVHELGHQRDLKGLVYDDKVCILEWSKNISMYAAIASYSYTINSSNYTGYVEARKNLEGKARIVDIIIIMLYSFCLLIIGNHYRKYMSPKI